jgi:hypothetical protein
MVFVFETTTFAEEQYSFGLDSTEEVHDERSVGRTHTKVDNSDTICTSREHVAIATHDFDAKLLGKKFDIVVEVGEQDVWSELVERAFGVAHEPIFDYFVFGFHVFLGQQSIVDS